MGMSIHELETKLLEFPDSREIHLVIDGEDYDIEIDMDDVEPIIRVDTR